ncbi:leukocyte elastase inhibitor A-like isoform X2 [Littorina saxatilis]|uniref:Serpin domain-containing protein n=1 Tax=Littorina saxatilis TaxID=31220 RepID=A0AAN9AN16_9CAEN
MASSCGSFTVVCVVALVLVAASLALANRNHDARAAGDVALARGMRNLDWENRRGNERIAVDGETPAGRRGGGAGNGGRRRGGNRRNNNGAGGRRGGRGRGRGRGRGQRPPFSRREMNLVGRLSDANAQFSLQMYSTLKQDRPELIFSPHSIHTALTMTYMGARDRTARQMVRTLGLRRLKKQKAHVAYAALTTSLAQPGNVTLNTANAVYSKPQLPIEEAFRTNLVNLYKAKFDVFDYEAENGPEVPINRWVASMTQDKVTDLLERGTITPLTAMVIVNAIYFKGNWKEKFEPDETSEQTFYQERGSTVPVQMMKRTANFNYSHSQALQAHVVELPYQDGRFSMYVILPETRGALNQVEAGLNLETLNHLLLTLRSNRVELHLPRFKSESKFSLKEALQNMGMSDPFSQTRASFSGICTSHDLFISDVIHQAVVEVSEEGTEAAAATGVVIGLRSFAPNPIEVKADHPFIYGIRDKLSKVWLFMGRYNARQ